MPCQALGRFYHGQLVGSAPHQASQQPCHGGQRKAGRPALGKGSKEEQRYKKCRRQQRGQRRQVRRGQLCQCEGKTKASQLTSHEFLVGKQGQRFKEDDILALGCIAFRQNSCLGHNGA